MIYLRRPVGTPVANDNSSATIPTATYKELSAALPVAASAVEVFNTSSKAIQLSLGAGGAEVAVPYIVPPSAIGQIIPMTLKKGQRLTAKALGADATTGFFVVNFLG